jgi:hypothetical protein
MFTKESERPDPFDRFFKEVTGREPSHEPEQEATVVADDASKPKRMGKLSFSLPSLSFSFGKKSSA